MNHKNLLLPIVVAVLAMPGFRAFSQAHVTESQTTYICVDASNGSDANDGSQAEPLQTIQAAVEKARVDNIKAIGTKGPD